MFFKYYYLLGSIIFFIGSYRVIIYKKYEFIYYNSLNLDNWSYPIGVIFFIIGIYFFSLFLKTNKESN